MAWSPRDLVTTPPRIFLSGERDLGHVPGARTVVYRSTAADVQMLRSMENPRVDQTVLLLIYGQMTPRYAW